MPSGPLDVAGRDGAEFVEGRVGGEAFGTVVAIGLEETMGVIEGRGRSSSL
jgi:hypothetical protein